MATAETTPADQGGESATASAKRKTLEEIEVDLALPEPPSKRARRALKKGKSLPPKTDDKDDDEDDDDDDDQKTDKKARSEHGIWVGNLPFTVRAADLRQWLIDNSGGVITKESITRLKLPKVREAAGEKKTAANKGFAYVDFVDMATKVAAVALSETELQHRKLLIKDARSFEGRPAPTSEKKREVEEVDSKGNLSTHGADKGVEASRKIFVGNMSFQTTEEDVRRNFEKCGVIEWVKVATFEDSGKCKGYGWVKFAEPEAAAWAVKGFVKIKEAVETEDDFNETTASEAHDGEKRQYKTRKWWVNRMLGRELKLELAEDDHVRYKKRFGKDTGNKQQRQQASGVGDAPKAFSKAAPPAPDLQSARLMGTVVDYAGTKVMLD